MEATRLLLVDDHAITRSGIRVMAESLDGVEVAAECSTGSDALRACAEIHPNVVLMDLQMPQMGGIEATRRIRQEHPEIQVLVLTVQEDEDAVFEAIQAGAAGYLSKACTLDDLREAIEAVRVGGSYMTPSVAGMAIRSLSQRAEKVKEAARVAEVMTDREREVLAELSRGLSARAISDVLGISERTVNTHIGHLYRKLGVNNRVDAVLEGLRLGLVEAAS
jgi:DNA-binding NarL/FixJ family response regulator